MTDSVTELPPNQSFLSDSDESPRNNRASWKWLLGLLVVIGVIIYLGTRFTKAESGEVSQAIQEGQAETRELVEKLNPSPEPTPFPFQEMTVPYVRRQDFSSSLGEQLLFSENNGFTTYTTSYLSDGLRINGLLTIPTGEMPEGGWPAVVFVHGYVPPREYRTTEKYDDYVNFLARNGLVVFKIDLRGHGSSEGEPGGGYYAGDYVIDTLNARAALQATDFVNPEKIGLWGHSMAGNVVMRAMASKPEIKAIVIWAGAVYSYEDFQEYGISDSSYQRPPSDSRNQQRRQQLFNTYGQFNKESEFWRQVAPTNYLSDLTGAIEIHHAVNDSVVSIEYSRNLARLLTNAGVEHQLFEYASGAHNIDGGAFTQAMQRTVEFYKSRLID